MGFLNGAKNVLAFLTIFPVGMDHNGFRKAADHIYLFPFVGALLGFIAGGIGWLILHVLPPLVVGALTLSVLEIFIGFHHMDGLFDFGDGVMANGSKNKKIGAMRDQNIGTGGLVLGIMVFLATALSFAYLSPLFIIPALILVETSAKFSMVVVAAVGKSARRGMNTSFVELMHTKHGTYRFLVALLASLAVGLVFFGLIGLITIAVSIGTALAMVGVTHMHFGGVTGDILGATNEISRMICILSVLVMIQWA